MAPSCYIDDDGAGSVPGIPRRIQAVDVARAIPLDANADAEERDGIAQTPAMERGAASEEMLQRLACRLLRKSTTREFGRRSSLDTAIVITGVDRERLRLLKPHAAILREIDRAAIVSPAAAMLALQRAARSLVETMTRRFAVSR